MRLISMAFLFASFGTSWLVMMFGWGLVPQSWPWIIFGTFMAILFAGTGQYIATLEQKDDDG